MKNEEFTTMTEGTDYASMFEADEFVEEKQLNSNISEVTEDEDLGSFVVSDEENNEKGTTQTMQQNVAEIEDVSFDTIEEIEEETKPKKVVSEGQIVVDEELDTITEGDLEQNNRQKITANKKNVDDITFETIPDDYVEYQRISNETGLTEQIEEDFGDMDIGDAEQLARDIEKEKLVDEEASVRAEEKAQVIVNQTIRSATEVLNQQNLLATREAEQNIRERQYRLEQKIKRNKYRDIRSKIGSAIFMACLIVGLYVCYSNPTLNKGIRSVLSSTLTMFSDLISGKEVDSNDVVNSLGTELNNNTMKYEYKTVDENGNEIIMDEEGE